MPATIQRGRCEYEGCKKPGVGGSERNGEGDREVYGDVLNCVVEVVLEEKESMPASSSRKCRSFSNDAAEKLRRLDSDCELLFNESSLRNDGLSPRIGSSLLTGEVTT